jgi:hypothetical protein
LLVGSLKIEKATAEAYDRLRLRMALADQFRSDVSRATAAPNQLGKTKSGPACLVLSMPDGKHVIYRWADGRLYRSEVAGSREAERPTPVGPECKSIEFTRTGDGRRLITMRLTYASARRAVTGICDIMASLAGDSP